MVGLSCWSKKMADVKISALPAATVPLAGTEVLPIVQSATTRQVSVANLTAGRAISASSATVAGRATFTASGFDAIAASTGTIQGQTSYGGVLAGSGSSYDVMLCNRSGSEVLGVIANTQNLYAAGNVGIGTAGPAAKLDISVASAAVDGTKGVRIANPAGTTVLLECGSSSDSFVGTTSGSDFNIRTNNTERVKFPFAGGVQAVTSISVGNATPSASGAGITFPATQSASSDANTLDDYEEGTWSASGITAVNATGTSFSDGRYTKIGNIVHIQGLFTLTVTLPNTLTYLVMNAPFTPAITTSGSVMDNGSLISGSLQANTNNSIYAFFAASTLIPAGATSWYVNCQYQV
jgi:hypothetical protein